MSRIGDIYNSYGSVFNIATANAYDYTVINASKLPLNTLIIASPSDENGEDVGIHSMILTDSYGEPVRLTYSIKEGSGLYLENDSLSLYIDEGTVSIENDKLSLNVNNLLDNDSLKLVNGTISSNTKVLQTSSKEKFGIVQVDGRTIKSDQGTIYVETENLDLADNSSNTKGIVYSDGSTISINNGVVSANTNNLQKAGQTFGITKVDGSSISSQNGTATASLNSFKTASDSEYGLSTGDNSTIYEENNILHADFSSLNGLIKVDGTSLTVENGILHMNGVVSISDALVSIGNQIGQIETRIDEIETRIENYSPSFNEQAIFAFTCNGLASAILIKPTEYGELPEDMPIQKISAEFTVRTNCPFNIAMEYEDNLTPQIVLYEINYNDIEIYPSNVGLGKTFQSTDNKDVNIKFSWLCKNYRSNNNEEYLNKTRVIIDIKCANDASIAKHIKYSIIRFNSLYNASIEYTGQNDEIIIDKYKAVKPNAKKYLVTLLPDSGLEYNEQNSYYWIDNENSGRLWPAYIENGSSYNANNSFTISGYWFNRELLNTNAEEISYIDSGTPGFSTAVFLNNRQVHNVVATVTYSDTSTITLTYNFNLNKQ